MNKPNPSSATLAYDAGAHEPPVAARIDALRLAIDVHLATLQLPDNEKPFLGCELHGTARSLARRLARFRGSSRRAAPRGCYYLAARLHYLLHLARDLGWLAPAVANALSRRADALRHAIEALRTEPPRVKPTSERNTVALIIRH